MPDAYRPSCYRIGGGHALGGEVRVGGAKNSALYLLASALLAPGATVIDRVPRIGDVHTMTEVLRHLGAGVEWSGDHEVTIDTPSEIGVEAPYELVSRMRASIAVLGPLVARTGAARVALPGGCNLGPRGIDLHLRGLEELGAQVRVERGFLEARADHLRGGLVELDYPSHGATANLMMAAVLATGTTVIDNASREPEIPELACFLQTMGASISGAGTDRIEINGVDGLRPLRFEVMPDRLEAGTYLMAAGAAGGDVTVTGMRPDHLGIVLDKLTECGVTVDTTQDSVRVRASGRPLPVDISTLPYPGFPTDLQPIVVALLSRAQGLSIVTENIFDARFMFVDELARMGADVSIEGHYAIVQGVPRLSGAPVRAPDIRAGAALVVAALAGEGETIVEDVHHIERGYEALHEGLASLGAHITRERSLVSV